MMMLKKAEGFRTPDENYWDYVFCVSDGTQQTSPFILYRDGVVKAITHLNILYEKAERNDLILHAWPGQWKTNVFAFRMSALMRAKKEKRR